MSGSGYKITDIKTVQQPTFNVWHDADSLCYIDYLFRDRLGEDGCGIVEVSAEDLRSAIAAARRRTGKCPDVLARMDKDLAGADYVKYYCY